jgi:DNA-binding response OmpR family regulator
MTPNPTPQVSSAGDPARVLVAEDDFELRRMIVWALRKDGYEVVEATDGTELLELVAEAYLSDELGCSYDLIVTDIRMPGWSGMQVLHGLHGQEHATPVVLITAFGDEETHRLAHRLGAVCVLDKPFEMDDLRMIVLNTVKQRHGAAPAIVSRVH